jgi:type I restriction enzyme S subunit
MSFPRYPKYKDSGVEWLGEVPEHWALNQGRRLFTQEREPARPTDDQLSATQKYGVVPQKLFMEMEDQKVALALNGLNSFKHVEAGDFVISLRSFQGGIERSAYPGCVSPAYTVLRPAEPIEGRFWSYLLKSKGYIEALQSMTDGIRDGKNISYQQFGQIIVPAIPLTEQTQIAAFLDRETAKIDELVAEQRRLMELLKEKRQAVISHAVTQGLNPDAPMKPSGIEWLGDVPAHWEIGRVKTYFRTCSGGTPNTAQQELYYADEDSGIPWVRTTDLQNDVLRSVEVFITDKALSDTACSILPPGTVMVAMYGGDGTVGKNGLLAISAAINQAVCGLLPSNTHSPEFVFRFMQFYRPHWMIGAESSRKDPNISQERVRNAPFLKPPRDEQDSIVNYLDAQTTAFDTLTAEAQRAIDLLQERRSALISAAVTGQIDVRLLSQKVGAGGTAIRSGESSRP